MLPTNSGELYKDLLDVFDRDIFHMGNDEISYKCWLSDSQIQDWLSSSSSELMDLWGMFQTQGELCCCKQSCFTKTLKCIVVQTSQINAALDKLRQASNGVKAIVWTSEMTNFARKFLSPEDYIIQIWSYGKEAHPNSM